MKQKDKLIQPLIRLLLFLAILAAVSFSGCAQKTRGKPVELELTVYLSGMVKESAESFVETLRRLANPYLPFSERSTTSPQVEIRLKDRALEIVRLDCPADKKVAITQWQDALFRTVKTFGSPRPDAYKRQWEKNGLGKVTMELLSGICKPDEVQAPDLSRVPPYRYSYVYVLSQRPEEWERQFGSSENVVFVKTPEEIWRDFYKRCENESGTSLRVAIVYDPTAPQPALGEAKEQLKVRISLEYLKDNRVVQAPQINTDLVLTSLTPYALTIEPLEEAYLYVLQIDPIEKVDFLFPNREYSNKENPVGERIRLPEDERKWFKLDETKGIEKIYVLAAPSEDRELEELIRQRDERGIVEFIRSLKTSRFLAPGSLFEEYSFTHK